MLTDKETEEAIEKDLMETCIAMDSFSYEELKEAYLSMKVERDKYKAIVERIANLETNSAEFMRPTLAVGIAKQALAIRKNKEE